MILLYIVESGHEQTCTFDVNGLNRPRKRVLRLEKSAGHPPICVKSFDLRQNRLLRMRVALYTKIDLKIEFSGSKNPLSGTFLCAELRQVILTRRVEIGRSYAPSGNRTFLLPPDDIYLTYERAQGKQKMSRILKLSLSAINIISLHLLQ